MRIPLILLVALLAGCSSVAERACTKIGCDDGIVVSISEARSDFALQIIEADGTVHERVCAAAATCDQFFFDGIRSETVIVRLVSGEQTIEREFEPAYERAQPNGPDCPPVCYQAQITFAL
jgi:hypothetical protein